MNAPYPSLPNREGKTMRLLKTLLADETAASAIEYALVASLIAVAGIVGMANLGNGVNDKYNSIENEM